VIDAAGTTLRPGLGRDRFRAVGTWPIIFGHRGARAYAPENTLAGFRLALAQQSSGVETDAWLARDGVPVLVHDATIRPPGRRIMVTQRTSAELAAFAVPTLADLYRGCGTNFELSIDVEHPAVAIPLVTVAESFNAVDRLWLCSEAPVILERLRNRSSRVRLVCSTTPRRTGGLKVLVPHLMELNVDVVNLHWADWNMGRVDFVHGSGLLAFGWDVQDDAAVDHLLSAGIDGLYGDRPDQLVARVQRAGPAPSSDV